jgi:hypothetical protein
MNITRQRLIKYWINRLKKAKNVDWTEYNHQKYLMECDLSQDECEIVFKNLYF